MPTAASPARASHAPYIARVVAELTALHTAVSEVTVADDAMRHAALRVTADHATNRGTAVLLHWDERDGWSAQALVPPEPHPRPLVHFGPQHLPGPGDVAFWTRFVLVHPGLTPSHPPGPPGTRDLEQLLRGYQSTTG